MNLNKTVKSILGIIGGIFLAALSGGLWEEVLRPTFHFIGILIIELMSHIFLSYKDNIYKQSSDGFHEYPSLFLMLVFIMALGFAYQMLVMKHPYAKDKQSKQETRFSYFIRSKWGYYLTYFISIFVIAFLSVFIAGYSYTNQIITYSNKSIAIVSPYINENERLTLSSEFSSIKKAEDFYAFKKHLDNIAKKNNLELEELSPF